MKLDFYPNVEKFIKTTQPKHSRQLFLKCLELSRNPYPNDAAKLVGFKDNRHRVDSGEYRIIYRVNDDDIQIMMIGKRNDDSVYRDSARLT